MLAYESALISKQWDGAVEDWEQQHPIVNDRYAPGSDVHILVVISESDEPFRNRVQDYLPRRFPVGLDVFPYTQDEANRLAFPRQALAKGNVLWERV